MKADAHDVDEVAARLAEAARAAGLVLARHRFRAEARAKADGSPVCAADLAADAEAKRVLAEQLPGVPIVSEETVADRVPEGPFLLLDPLDGTREFLAGGDSYCVAIAYVGEGRALAGALCAPALGRAWYGGRRAFGRRLAEDGGWAGPAEPIAVRPVPPAGPVALVSRFHGDSRSDAILARLAPAEQITLSSAAKFGLIASGEADLNIRCGPTMAWDVAAGDALLAAAGGVLCGLDGQALDYRAIGRDSWRNPPFVAASSAVLAKRAVAAASG